MCTKIIFNNKNDNNNNKSYNKNLKNKLSKKLKTKKKIVMKKMQQHEWHGLRFTKEKNVNHCQQLQQKKFIKNNNTNIYKK